MERLNRRKTETRKDVQRRPRRIGKLLVEGLAGLAIAGVIASCAASATVSARGEVSASSSASASSAPAGFGMPTLHESEIRLKKQGDSLEAEVREITDIECDAANRCTTDSTPLKSVKLSFEVYDSNSRRFREIEGCTEEKHVCDISKVPRGARIRVRFVPPQDFERPVRGDTATTVRE